ncbi:hypothetical protein [Terrabacter sp. BE26]|uniref:hypothetical protein n=1 Tax=Terrabacter sp. BE26 TaxID=2898152 RepID=UPI0035BEA38C
MASNRALIAAAAVIAASCTALGGCGDGGTSLQQSCQSFYSRYKATNADAVASDFRAFASRLGPLYAEVAKNGDSESKSLFEPAAKAMQSLGNGGAYEKSTRDALNAVDQACSPWGPRS